MVCVQGGTWCVGRVEHGVWAGWDMVCGQGGTCCVGRVGHGVWAGWDMLLCSVLLCWFCHDMLVDARHVAVWGVGWVRVACWLMHSLMVGGVRWAFDMLVYVWPVAVWAGWDTSSSKLVELCGNNFIQSTYLSSSIYLLVHFHSDHTNAATGFRLTYQTSDDPS